MAKAPDVPVSRVIVDMQGGEKGLFVNSRNLCAAANRTKIRLDAHNNRRANLRPPLRAQCKKGAQAKRRAGHRQR